MRCVLFIFVALLTLFGCQKNGEKPKINESKSTIVDTGWVAVAPLPEIRSYATSFSLNSKGYVCSGVIDFTDSYAVYDPNMYMYDPIQNIWTKKAGLPPRFTSSIARKSPFSFVVNGQVYAGGGTFLNGGEARDFEKYDFVNDKWSFAGPDSPPFEPDLSTGVAVSYKGKGYVFTMETNTYMGSNKIFEFNPIGNILRYVDFKIGLLDVKSRWIASDDIRFLCGIAESYAYFVDINTTNLEHKGYDPGTYYSSLPKEQILTHNGIIYKNSVYVCFGNAGHLYRFNFIKNRWQIISLQDLKVTEGVTSFLLGSKFYVAGGNNGVFTHSTNKVWMIDLDNYPEN